MQNTYALGGQGVEQLIGGRVQLRGQRFNSRGAVLACGQINQNLGVLVQRSIRLLINGTEPTVELPLGGNGYGRGIHIAPHLSRGRNKQFAGNNKAVYQSFYHHLRGDNVTDHGRVWRHPHRNRLPYSPRRIPLKEIFLGFTFPAE